LQDLPPLKKVLAGEERAEWISERLRAAVGLSETAAPSEEIFLAVRKLFEVLAREQPLVVRFEDVHWADPVFLDLVEHFFDWSRDAPILILCESRPELLDERSSWPARPDALVLRLPRSARSMPARS
jgi:predicted ATPase